MNRLIVYEGDADYVLPPSDGGVFFYGIGGGRPVGSQCTPLNDWRLLNRYAEQLRDEYAAWVLGHNDVWVRHRLVQDDLSLFFLTDFSCKRSELFDTYRSICNISVLREKTQRFPVERARLVGVTRAFVTAFQSAFPGVAVETERLRPPVVVWWRRALSDARHFANLLLVALSNRFQRMPRQRTERRYQQLFLSSFPNMFAADGRERKYGGRVGSRDGFLMSILTDGLHQYVPFGAYRRHRRSVDTRDTVIDDHLRVSDVGRGLYWWFRMCGFLWRERRRRHVFMGIDVSAYTRMEWLFSRSRVSRLMSLSGAIDRALAGVSAERFIYYLHEFPYGRLFSYTTGSRHPGMERIGFQHGPASWRKLFYFMARGEASAQPPYLAHAPIPDRVLAEDPESRDIYCHAGYQNVDVMDRIDRLAYLEGIRPAKRPRSALIATGLHDGPAMMSELAPVCASFPDVTFLVKPHPLGRKDYLEKYRASNVVMTDQPINQLLAEVGKVYVTYSSVGPEARTLGLDVEVVNLPGIVNESPLLPKADS
ncbi:MAG: hypothetical protein AB7L71_02060 [Vicinamibacterales bacterium]